MEVDIDQKIEDAQVQGKIIEKGWLSLRRIAVPSHLPEEVVEDLRRTFFAGASYMFHQIMASGDNIDIVNRISDELRDYMKEIEDAVAKEEAVGS